MPALFRSCWTWGPLHYLAQSKYIVGLPKKLTDAIHFTFTYWIIFLNESSIPQWEEQGGWHTSNGDCFTSQPPLVREFWFEIKVAEIVQLSASASAMCTALVSHSSCHWYGGLLNLNAVVPPQKIPVKNLKWVLTICNLKWSKGGYIPKYSMRNYIFPALKKMF